MAYAENPIADALFPSATVICLCVVPRGEQRARDFKYVIHPAHLCSASLLLSSVRLATAARLEILMVSLAIVEKDTHFSVLAAAAVVIPAAVNPCDRLRLHPIPHDHVFVGFRPRRWKTGADATPRRRTGRL